MKKLKRFFWAISFVGLIVSITGCVSFFTRSFTAQIVDSSKQPVSDAFVMFDYCGANFDSSYRLGQSMVKTDKNGKFTIPLFVHFHDPLFTSGAKPEIVGIYSPTTHSFAAQGDFLKDFNDQRPSIHRITLPNNKDDSAAWANALRNAVFAFDSMTMEKGGINSIVASDGIKKEFVNMLHSEFESYKTRFGIPTYPISVFFKSDESSVQEWQKELQSLP
jgi:hypothetical protein